MPVDRRGFFKGAAAGVTGAVVAGAVIDALPTNPAFAATSNNDDSGSSVAFHGRHQAGIVTPQQRFANFSSFNVIANNRAELKDLFITLTERARYLTSGIPPAESSLGKPPLDSGIIGPNIATDRLSVTIGVGN